VLIRLLRKDLVGLSVGPPKSRAGIRTVDVPATVCAELTLHLDDFVGRDDDDLVFAASTGAYLRRRNMYRVFYPARIAVGLPHLHLHDLRHLAGTLGTLSGATTREQQQRLGHASPAAALRYQHVVDGRGRAVAEGIDRLLRAEELLATNRPSPGQSGHSSHESSHATRPPDLQTTKEQVRGEPGMGIEPMTSCLQDRFGSRP
jgi:integrase